MPVYSYDHIHLRTHDPMATAQYYHRMFDAKIVESIQSDGKSRIDLDINGMTVSSWILSLPMPLFLLRLLSRILAWTTLGCWSTTLMPRTPNSPSAAPSSLCHRVPFVLVSELLLSRRQTMCG